MAKRLKVDVNNLLLSQPDYGEQALEIVDTLVRSNALDVIVIDSVAALVPRSEIEGEMGDPQMAMQATTYVAGIKEINRCNKPFKNICYFHKPVKKQKSVSCSEIRKRLPAVTLLNFMHL